MLLAQVEVYAIAESATENVVQRDHAQIIGIGRAIGFAQELEAVHRIFRMAGTVPESPAALTPIKKSRAPD